MDLEVNNIVEKDPNDFVRIWKKVNAFVVGFFTIIIFAVFPLIYKDFYFDILQVKYKFYYMTVILMAVVVLLVAIIFLCIDLAKTQGSRIKQIISKCSLKKLTNTDWCMLAFLLLVTISTLQSDYLYESFWGNEGRFTGLFLILIYGVSFFIISKCLVFRQWYLDVFLAAGMAVCIVGILHYFRLDPLGFKTHIDPKQYNSFTSTLGNINTYTAYVSLVLGAAAVLFIIEKNIFRRMWYFVCTVIALFAIITGISDNAYLALLALLGLLPLYCFTDFKGLKRYFVILALLFTEFQLIDSIATKYPEHVTTINGLFNVIVGYSKLAYIVIALWVICGVLYIVDFKMFHNEGRSLGKWATGIWLSVIIIVIMSGIFILYDVNIAGNVDKYGALKKYLVINDDWGTHRWYIWRIGMENYNKFSLNHKIFGFGPDTFGIITVNNNYNDMVKRYNEIFDSAHNEYLQYLITIGIAGLTAYLALLGSAIISMIRYAKKSPYVIASLFAIICYGAQAFVNINLPIATPVMWTMMMVGLAGRKNFE